MRDRTCIYCGEYVAPSTGYRNNERETWIHKKCKRAGSEWGDKIMKAVAESWH